MLDDVQDWNGTSDDVKFQRSMKPEGITTNTSGGRTKILVVDDGGGYARVDARHQFADQ